jgi:hypothetical protein
MANALTARRIAKPFGLTQRLLCVRSRVVLGLAASAWALAGCGGFGSSRGPSLDELCATGQVVSSFEYRTSWASDDPALGRSQVVTLLDRDRRPVESRVVNRTGPLQASFEGLASGTYTVQADLRSQADGHGLAIGRVTAILELCGTDPAKNTLRTIAGGEVAGVRLWPSNATVRNNESRQFAATAVDAGGQGVFVPDGTFDFEVLGGIGTINEHGTFLATAPGAGAVRATHRESGRTGSATVTVVPYTPPRAEWTILVYMGAASDLYPFSTLNVNQMERVADNPDLRFVVQWKQSRALFPGSSFDGTRRYLVTPDTTEAIRSRLVQDMGAGVDMGSPETLREFIEWGKRTYPSDRYGLIVWSHGNGWRRTFTDGQPTRAVSFDDETGNAIFIWDLDRALGTHRFEFIAWDASLMQMMEVAYEIRGNTPFVVGSQESPPGEGYPYDLVFAPFRNHPEAPTGQLVRSFVDATLGYSPFANRKITQSVIDTSKLPAVATALDELGRALFAHRTALQTVAPWVRANAQSYSPTRLRFYRDLVHLCALLETHPDAPGAVRAAAREARARATAAVAWEGSNVHSPNSNGIAIDFSPGDTFAMSQGDYRELKLAQDTWWDEWLMVAP